MGKRRYAREMAMQMLYQRELADTSVEQIFTAFDLRHYEAETDLSAGPMIEEQQIDQTTAARVRSQIKPSHEQDPAPAAPRNGKIDKQILSAFEYARDLVRGTLRNSRAIDAVIRRHAQNWRLERMPAIDRNILRLAIYEMLFESAVPKVVILDEAIELAKKFGSEQSGSFVNGLLDGVLNADEEPVEGATS